MTDKPKPISTRDVLIRATPLGLAVNQTADWDEPFRPFPWLVDLNRFVMWMMASPKAEALLLKAAVGHGKTTYAARWLIVWFMSVFPRRSVILATHTQGFADEAGEFIRDQLVISAPQYGWSFDGGDGSARSHFKTPFGGRFYALGRGSAISGRHVDLEVIDDPYANAKEAMSPAIRLETWRWITGDIMTRLKSDGKFILTHARWHSDDAIGRYEREQQPGSFQTLSYPAICEKPETDQMGRQKDEVLEPRLWPWEALKAREERIGPYFTAALLQQQPGKDSGTVFDRDWFKYYDRKDNRIFVDGGEIDSEGLYWFITCDPAKTVSERSDWTVVGLFALDTDSDPSRLFLVDMVRQQLETPDLTPLIEHVYRENPQVSKIYVESVDLFQYCERAGLPVEQLKPTSKKWLRAQPAAAWFKSGRVLFPNEVKWMSDVRDEMLEFPNGTHDDIVDVIVYGVLKAQDIRTKYLY